MIIKKEKGQEEKNDNKRYTLMKQPVYYSEYIGPGKTHWDDIMDKTTIDKAIDNVRVSLPEPSEEEKLLDQKYKEEQERKKKRKKVWITVAISIFLIVATFVGFGVRLCKRYHYWS